MSDLARPVPPPRSPAGDWRASVVLAASLLLHGAAVAAFVASPDAKAARPVETPIEVVQLPPEKEPAPKAKGNGTDKPKGEAVKTAEGGKPPEPERDAKPRQEAKQPEQKHAKQEQSKPEQAAAKKAEQKQVEPKKVEPKKVEPKQAASKHGEAKRSEARREASRPSDRGSAEARSAEARRPEAPQDRARQAAGPASPAPSPPQQSTAERMAQLIGAPMNATALPAMAAGAGGALDDAVPYQQLVLSLVAKQKREGRHDGVPGYAVVAFEIGDHGEVLSCELRKKSQDPAQDAEAVAMVYRGAPYPAPPPGATRQFAFGLRFQVL